MGLSISQLKSKWEREKKSYTKREVGMGVQKFVKDMLKSEALFDLEEGFLSTKLEDRINEFVEEKPTKARRTADVVIYINSDIVIPVEVERYGEIEQGLGQLRRYQRDLNKKYGILTDGGNWQFFNNDYEVKRFRLEEIFRAPELFLEFWREYIKPEFYYLSFFEERGQLRLIPKDLTVDKKREEFFQDITTLIKGLKLKLEVEGYFYDKEEKEKLELTYAYIIQFILYKTLVDNEFGDFKQKFDEMTKAIHLSLKEQRYKDILGIIDGIQTQISENIYWPFKAEHQVIMDTIMKLIRQIKNELRDVSPWLDIFVFIKKYDFANVRNEIFGYVYENYLKEVYEKKKWGQYFTDPAVVDFMLDQVGYNKETIRKRMDNDPAGEHISLIDPACGSGTFLYNATNRVMNAVPNGSETSSKKVEKLINNNIFGLDIAEFPLYLAEMNILMRLLPLIITEKYNNPMDKKIKVFLTKDSIAEFIHAELENINTEDLNKKKAEKPYVAGNRQLQLGYESYVRDEGDLTEMKSSMRPPRRRFDFVIGNPPYIPYNECSRQGISIIKMIGQGKAHLNNIYGVNLHSTPYLQKKSPPKPNLYIFFIALGLALLKEESKLCYIVPQTLLINANFDVIRYHLAKFTTIERIIMFKAKMFIGRGLTQKKAIPTSSLIFVVSKTPPVASHKVEVINYKKSNHGIEETLRNIKAGKEINKKEVLQLELLKKLNNWNFIKLSKKNLDLCVEYGRNTEDMSVYYEHVKAQRNFESKFYFDIGYNIDEQILLKAPQEGLIYQYPLLDNKFWTIKSIKGYWPNVRTGKSRFRIKLLKANQGFKLLDSKYKILWSYNNTGNFFFSERPLIWSRNKIIGIGSSNKEELYYLFALLNSPITAWLLRKTVRIEHEDTRTILVSLRIVKDQIRIPRINQGNYYIKEEIIRTVEKMLALEKQVLSDLVDFSAVMMQKLHSFEIKGNKLILLRGDRKFKCKITDQPELVARVISEHFGEKTSEAEPIFLKNLKYLPAIDLQKQKALKDYIDDLVFALYFNVDIGEVGFDRAWAIKEACGKHRFYRTIQEL